jgi:hypothetical protein
MKSGSGFGAAFICTAAVAAAAAVGPAAGAVQSSDAAQPSSRVAVVPGFEAPVYAGRNGLAPFPAGEAALQGYKFAQMRPGSLSPGALQEYDTIVLYGQRWSDLPAAAKTAINEFARTGKVIIWDADSTGGQTYGSFLKPFSTLASGEDGVTSGSVVAFPSAANPLASDDPASPLYLDPRALVALPLPHGSGRLVAVDRAGNTTVSQVSW